MSNRVPRHDAPDGGGHVNMRLDDPATDGEHADHGSPPDFATDPEGFARYWQGVGSRQEMARQAARRGASPARPTADAAPPSDPRRDALDAARSETADARAAMVARNRGLPAPTAPTTAPHVDASAPTPWPARRVDLAEAAARYDEARAETKAARQKMLEQHATAASLTQEEHKAREREASRDLALVDLKQKQGRR